MVSTDSVLVSYEILKQANAKLIELKYEKEINDSLRSIIKLDDELIRQYNNKVNVLQKQVIQEKRKVSKYRWGGIGATLLLVISLIIK